MSSHVLLIESFQKVPSEHEEHVSICDKQTYRTLKTVAGASSSPYLKDEFCDSKSWALEVLIPIQPEEIFPIGSQ